MPLEPQSFLSLRLLASPLSAMLAFLLCAGVVRAQTQFNVLVLAVPEKWHKDCVPVAHESFERMALHHQFGLTWSEDPAALEKEDLTRFAAIVFVNCTGEVLGEAGRARLEAFVRNGGGFVAVHAAAATGKKWPWYDRLIGRTFRIHPYVQTAVVHVVDRDFPAAFGLPERWLWTDEWYEFDAPLAPDLHTVLRVDEKTYDPHRIWPGQRAEGMGEDHPVAWWHTFEGGRVFVTALGHMPELYRDETYLGHLYGAIYWAATGRGAAR